MINEAINRNQRDMALEDACIKIIKVLPKGSKVFLKENIIVKFTVDEHAENPFQIKAGEVLWITELSASVVSDMVSVSYAGKQFRINAGRVATEITQVMEAL